MTGILLGLVGFGERSFRKNIVTISNLEELPKMLRNIYVGLNFD